MNWIKIESNTPDKIEVFQMSEILGIDPDAVLGKLIRLWIWFDENTVNGVTPSVTKALLNRYTCNAKLVDAALQVGWLIESDDKKHLIVPNYERHNSNNAKSRCLSAKRVGKMRKRNKSVTDVTLKDDNSVTDVTENEESALPKRYTKRNIDKIRIEEEEERNTSSTTTVNTDSEDLKNHPLIVPFIPLIKKYTALPVLSKSYPKSAVISCDAELQAAQDLCFVSGDDFKSLIKSKLNSTSLSNALTTTTCPLLPLKQAAAYVIKDLSAKSADKRQSKPKEILTKEEERLLEQGKIRYNAEGSLEKVPEAWGDE